ncbi:alpha-L-fucosidase [Embleya sp. NPDC059259]|uniref:alpha-L-fucosidase n=1 Tax=unclassified Embleya TaxID=2699296 RepID=UPI00367DC050
MLRRWCTILATTAAMCAPLVVVAPTAQAASAPRPAESAPAAAPGAVPQAGQVPLPVDQKAVKDNVTTLMGTAAERTPSMSVFAPDTRKNFWVENFKTSDDYLAWTVTVPKGDVYRITGMLNAAPGQTFRVGVRGSAAATGFVQPGGGWARVDAGKLTLPSGTSTIVLDRTGTLAGDAQVKSLELVREKDRPAREARIAAARANTSDFASAGYGLMFQYGSWGFPENGGPAKSLDRQAADFDVPAFVKMVKGTGAAYVIWSYSWWGYHVDGPNAAIDKIVGNGDLTARRDLIGEIADALHAEGLGFTLYYHLGTEDAAWWPTQKFPDTFYTTGTGDRSTLLTNWKQVVADIGNRYGTRLDGFFFDDGLIYYPAPFEELEKIARTGNPRRMVSWNSWILPRYTDFQDTYFAEEVHGEAVDGSAPVGGNGIFRSGPQKGLLQHAMFRMEDDWGIHLRGQKIGGPNFSAKQAVDWALDAASRKVPLSFNLMMYEDGKVSEQSLSILNEVRQALRGNAERIDPEPVNQDDAGFAWDGAWQHTSNTWSGDLGDDVQASTANGGSVTYTFTGTAADVLGPRNLLGGKYDVYLDGALVQRLDGFSWWPKPQSVLYAARHLAPGTHTIKLVKVSGVRLTIDGARMVEGPAALNDTDSAVAYQGAWTHSGNRGAGDHGDDVTWSSTNGDSVTITFTGSAVDVLAPMGDGYATADVTLDGVAVGTATTDNGGSYAARQKVYSARFPASGPHTVTLTKTGGSYLQFDAAYVTK